MTSRTIPAAMLAMVALAAVSCSKTQDTAPERRVFGDPPTILQVDDDEAVFLKRDQPVRCDFTDTAHNYLCGNADPPILNVTFQDPGVFIAGTYTEVTLRAKVTDKNSPPAPAPSNILLVSASFTVPDSDPKTETSLVLFDDGSTNRFRIAQKVQKIGYFCPPNSSGTCLCYPDKFEVTSGDDLGGTGDGFYTRKVAIVDKTSLPYPGADGFIQDCIMRATGMTPILASEGDAFDFKIEAVDRQGNTAEWSKKVHVVVGTNTFGCDGDLCGCCVLLSSVPTDDPQNGGCRDLPGTTNNVYPDGFCVAF